MNKFISILLLNLFILGCNEKVTTNEKNCIDINKIEEDVACIEIYQPVCGCNNVTYSNDCYASRNGLTSWENGVCN
tara:strand:- start:211 stop:438 length:228 start_codon:yes stop_codon:yes gene_type:complete